MRITLKDVAEIAGVSLATVDRVVNDRPGVREKTVAKVKAAIAQLDWRPDHFAVHLSRGTSYRFCFLLPTGNNTFMQQLGAQIERAGEYLKDQRVVVETRQVDVFDPDALAEALEQVNGDVNGVGTIALDHPIVNAAINDLVGRGVPVVTLVSDAPRSSRLHYVGIDNPAAGRTAGSLMGRFLGARKGKIGVIAGSLGLRDHAERQFGFQQVMNAEYPQIAVLPAREGRDDVELNRALTSKLLVEHRDLVGLYNIGAGNRGIAAALEESGRAKDIVFIGHELTEHSRKFLLKGTMDAVIDQAPGHEARSACRVLLSHCTGDPILEEQERIRIAIFIRDNLP
jgi:LacI family transcriptional regulator